MSGSRKRKRMRRILVLVLFTLPLAAQVREQITVERILVDARVTDDMGEPILGLTPADFIVKIDGKLAKVESVDWIPDTAAQREIAGIEEAPPPVTSDVPAPKGRLFIYFFQT